MKRREFLRLSSAATLLGSAIEVRAAGAAATATAASPGAPAAAAPAGSPDYTLRIGTGLIDLSAQHLVSTTLYNGQFPGPLLRLQQGRRTSHRHLQRHRHTRARSLARADDPERCRRGRRGRLAVRAAARHAPDCVSCRSRQDFASIIRTSSPGADLNRGTYTGPGGTFYIEPVHKPGAYDREVFLVLKEFAPTFSRGGDMDDGGLAGLRVAALKRWERQPTSGPK